MTADRAHDAVRGRWDAAAFRRAFVACVVVGAAAWTVGYSVRDRWEWSQFLFWTPGWAVTPLALAAAWAARRGTRRRVSRMLVAFLVAVGCIAAARTLRWDVGWRLSMPPRESRDVSVTHWNPQWPGDTALECGKALAPSLGDVTVISSPGKMFRSTVAAGWLPAGARVVDRGLFAVATWWQPVDVRVLASQDLPGAGPAWTAWIVVQSPDGRVLRILAVDTPSSPKLARGEVARVAADLLRRVPPPEPPDVVLGDLNCTPGSVVHDAVAPGFAAAPPWCAFGWMGTYRRPWPVFRIDAMLAGPSMRWHGYRTLDLGVGQHRAQFGVLAWAPR